MSLEPMGGCFRFVVYTGVRHGKIEFSPGERARFSVSNIKTELVTLT